MKQTIYFDYAATTFPKPERVYEAMDQAGRSYGVNAGRGGYALSRKATEVIDSAREKCNRLVGGSGSGEVYFTPSATIAANEIIGGIAFAKEDVVYVSPYEHNAVMRPLHLQQEKIGFTIEELPLQEDTLAIDLHKTEYLFTIKPPKAVFVNHMSNVTGYILPVEKINELAKEKGALTVVDASQSLGLLPVNVQRMQADMVLFAGHKNLYGPFGTGGFYKNAKIKLNAYLAGGTGSDSLNLSMPENISFFEPASPNIIALAGLDAALSIVEEEGLSSYEEKEREAVRILKKELSDIYGVRVYPDGGDSIGMVSFSIDGYTCADAGFVLDEDYGIAVRTGYHCAPLIHKYLKDKDSVGVIRASVGRYTSREEIEVLLEAVKELAE